MKPSSEQEQRDQELSRRRFLQGAAAVAGASAVVPGTAVAAPAGGSQAVDPRSLKASGKIPNPLVPNFPGQYGGPVPDFQVPRRPMGKTSLQVSILGMGGYHLGTASGQQEVTNMVAKALEAVINFAPTVGF